MSETTDTRTPLEPMEIAYIGMGFSAALGEIERLRGSLGGVLVGYSGGGQLELVDECTQVCIRHLGSIPSDLSFDGVFVYDVVEPFARWVLTERLHRAAPLLDAHVREALHHMLERVADVPIGALLKVRSPINALQQSDFPDPDKVKAWFGQMADAGFLFHPDDDPSTIIKGLSGLPTFTRTEADHLRVVMNQLRQLHGDHIHHMAMSAITPAIGP